MLPLVSCPPPTHMHAFPAGALSKLHSVIPISLCLRPPPAAARTCNPAAVLSNWSKLVLVIASIQLPCCTHTQPACVAASVGRQGGLAVMYPELQLGSRVGLPVTPGTVQTPWQKNCKRGVVSTWLTLSSRARTKPADQHYSSARHHTSRRPPLHATRRHEGRALGHGCCIACCAGKSPPIMSSTPGCLALSASQEAFCAHGRGLSPHRIACTLRSGHLVVAAPASGPGQL